MINNTGNKCNTWIGGRKTLLISVVLLLGGGKLTLFSQELPAEGIKVEASCVEDTASRWSLSSNLAAWGLSITNISAEYQFADHWTANLSVYYSAWNYFSSLRKFRTFIFRPETRYWFNHRTSGLFIDMHAQVAAYNFAKQSWRYRIQDRGGDHPALGGGAGIGYRLPIDNSRWAFEAQVGAGVYYLDYNRYVNERKGRLYDSRRCTWVGIDNVAINIVYHFSNFSRR